MGIQKEKLKNVKKDCQNVAGTDVTRILDSPCIFPTSSQDRKAPTGWRGKYVCFFHTMNEGPLYLRATARGKTMKEIVMHNCMHYNSEFAENKTCK